VLLFFCFRFVLVLVLFCFSICFLLECARHRHVSFHLTVHSATKRFGKHAFSFPPPPPPCSMMVRTHAENTAGISRKKSREPPAADLVQAPFGTMIPPGGGGLSFQRFFCRRVYPGDDKKIFAFPSLFCCCRSSCFFFFSQRSFRYCFVLKAALLF